MYQFVHVEAYSRQAPKTAQHKNKKTGKASSKAGGHCVSYIVKEATRDPGSIPHIENPMPPIHHYGEPLEALETTCEEWAASMTDARGHKLRKDALCVVAGIVSAPHDIDENDWTAFREDAIEWLKRKYGAALRTVIEHQDESHPHLHFYVVPEAGQRFETVHQGKAAAQDAKREGGKKGEQNQAYKAAMRDFQDEFYDAVGIKHGFTRIGPGKRRLTREEWKLEQIQAAASAKAIAVAEKTVDSSKFEAEAIKEKAVKQAKSISAQALAAADKIEQEAEKKGFAQGLDAVEKMPWWKKAITIISGAVRERDQLRERVVIVESEARTWKEKAANWFRAGKKANEELKVVKPRLEEVEAELSVTQRQAKEAAQLREKVELLEDRLHRAGGRIKHLETVESALLERLEPERPETEPVGKKQRRERETGLER